jgi:hypothetical protein
MTGHPELTSKMVFLPDGRPTRHYSHPYSLCSGSPDRDLTFFGTDSENSQVAPAQAFSREERVGERGAHRPDATAPV